MTADSVHRFLIAYDIASDARRNRIAKLLQAHGDRLQYSVFLVDTKPSRLLRLTVALHALMDVAVDSALICDLGPLTPRGPERLQFMGQERSYTNAESFVM